MSTETQTPNQLYFAAWRWHFYAGLYTIPFLAMLAATGLILLWFAVLTGISDEKLTIPRGDQVLPVSALIASAEAAIPGTTASDYVAQLSPNHVATVVVAVDDASIGVRLNPYTGEVLNQFLWRAGWYDVLTDIHRSLLIVDAGDWMIEAAASLGLLLVICGLFLHWPRNGWGRVLTVQVSALRRTFWKSLDGAVGLWASLILVVFLISGLSWAGFWGAKSVQAWSTFPADKWEIVPLSDATHAELNHGAEELVPRNLEQTPMPESGSLARTVAIQGPVTIDGVVAFAQSLGFDRRFQLNLPIGETFVWAISHDSMSNDGPDSSADLTIHIDRYTDKLLADVRFAEFSPAAKMIGWGIAFHEGDLGLWNIVLNTVFCPSLIVMAVSGLILWLKRRPGGARLGAPPRHVDIPYAGGALLITLALSPAFRC